MTKLTIKKSFSSPVTKIYILNFLDELESGILRRLKEDIILIANLNSNKSMTDLKFIQSFNIKRESDCNLAIETVIEDVKTKIKLDLPASEERKLLNSIIKSPLLAESVVNNLFHPTKRRDTLIECLNNYFSNIIEI
jgi:hypothetical protein